jgi:hypothetical protein
LAASCSACGKVNGPAFWPCATTAGDHATTHVAHSAQTARNVIETTLTVFDRPSRTRRHGHDKND